MNEKWRTEVQTNESAVYLRLYGVLDEDNDLAQRGDVARGKQTAIIDSSGVERINSCGVRDWVTWLEKISAGGAKVVLVGCSPAIVQQINLVQNFTTPQTVKSFYAPYFCPKCDTEKLLLLDARALGPAPVVAPSCRCDECDGAMDFDDLPQSYFAFLQNIAPVSDDTLDTLIGKFILSEAKGSGSVPAIRDSLPPIPSLRGKAMESSARIERVDFSADKVVVAVAPAIAAKRGNGKWIALALLVLALVVAALISRGQ